MATALQSEVAAQKDFLPAQRNRSCGVLGRQCPPGRLFLPARFWHETGRLRRTGNRHPRSRFLRSGTGQGSLRNDHPAAPDGDIAEHVRVHGDGVRDVALWVDDARQAWKETTKRGARSVREPFEMKDEHGTVRMSTIAAYGDTVHTFVERGELQRAPSCRAIAPCPRIRSPRPSACCTSTTWSATLAGTR